MKQRVSRIAFGLFLLGLVVPAAYAEIKVGTPVNTVSDYRAYKYFIAFDNVNMVYLAVWDGAPVKGVFLDRTGQQLGPVFLIANQGEPAGWCRVTFGGTPDNPRFLVTYTVENGSTNPHYARLVTYTGGGSGHVGQAILIDNLYGELTASENAISIWTGTQFAVNWRVGTASGYPMGNTALRGMDTDGNWTTDKILIGDNLDHEVNAATACGPLICMAFGYAVGVPFGPDTAGASWGRLFDKDSLQPVGPVFYTDDHTRQMEDQRVVFSNYGNRFLTVWVRGRAYIDFRTVEIDGALGPLDLSKSVGPGWGQLGFSYNRTARTALLTAISPTTLSNGQVVPDLRAFEVGDDGYPLNRTNFIVVSDPADQKTDSFNTHNVADTPDGQWMVIYRGGAKYGRVVRVDMVTGVRIRSVTPSSGPSAGGTPVTIDGAEFQNGATVAFGGVPATGVTFVSSTQLQATTPHSTTIGPVAVTVNNPDGTTTTRADAYTYTALTLTLTTMGSGTVKGPGGLSCPGTCTAIFDPGTVVTLNVNPGAGYVFGGWGGDSDCQDGSVTVDTSKTCAALFTPDGVTTYRKTDWSGDAYTDVLWQHPTGTVYAWFMTGPFQAGGALLMNGPTDWRVVAAGDFDNDGKADIVWQHPGNGAVAIWLMDGATMRQAVLISPGNGNTDWRIVGAGDIDGDGKTDLLWQHPTGRVAVWLMDGTTFREAVLLSDVTPWKVVGTGDFDHDGKTDILWQHPTGTVAVWLMDHLTFRTGLGVMTDPTAWKVVGTADLDADGQPDILWQHPLGSAAVWFMNGTTFRESLLLSNPTAWRLVGPR